jgi:hypothetical protein
MIHFAVILSAVMGTPPHFFVQEERGPKGPRGPKPPVAVPVPFPFVSKRSGFEVILPTKEQFNPMQALVVDIPPALYPKLKAPQKFVQMEFGYKKGGIITLYETPKIPGGDAQSAFQATLKGRAFNDRPNLPGWSIQIVPHPKYFIGVGATDSAVRKAFMQNIAFK